MQLQASAIDGAAAANGTANGAAKGSAASEPPADELTVAMRGLFKEMGNLDGPAAAEAVRPTGVLSAVSAVDDRYAKRAEQDAHEMLRQLLEGLRTEMSEAHKQAAPAETAPPAEEPPTLVDELFSGELR